MKPKIAILILLALTSCAMPQFAARSPIIPQSRIIKSFTPETTITKTVGETMVERGDLRVFPGFMAIEEFSLPAIQGQVFPPIAKGSTWTCMQLISADEYACARTSLDEATGQVLPVVVLNDMVINKSGDIVGIAGRIYSVLTKFDNVISGKLMPVESPVKGSYKQELIYNGKSKDTIKISYREYRNDMARPAFFQDLTYDLLESREIAFRDLRIVVIEATNSAITFSVKK